MSHDFLQILGMSPESAQARQFVCNFGEQPDLTDPDPELENRYYITFQKSGVSLVVNGDLNMITDVMIHLTDVEFSAYEGEIPFGLNAQSTRDESRQMFGSPERQGGPVTSILTGEPIFWDLWQLESHKLHLEYSSNQSCINLITLSAT